VSFGQIGNRGKLLFFGAGNDLRGVEALLYRRADLGVGLAGDRLIQPRDAFD
jgi:hypothetical protein